MRRYSHFLLLITVFLSACGVNSAEDAPHPGQNALRIPELLDSRDTPEIELVMQNGRA